MSVLLWKVYRVLGVGLQLLGAKAWLLRWKTEVKGWTSSTLCLDDKWLDEAADCVSKVGESRVIVGWEAGGEE